MTAIPSILRDNYDIEQITLHAQTVVYTHTHTHTTSSIDSGSQSYVIYDL